MSTSDRPQNGDPLAEVQRLFQEDTVEVQVGDRQVIGVVTRTWSDLDGEGVEWDEIDEAIPGARATQGDIHEFQRTGQPPRGFLLFSPSSPYDSPMLVHESECKLLDRALMFGDVVKQSSSSAQSGTVIAVDSTVTLRPAYFDPSHHELWPPNVETRGVRGSELELAADWNHGDFVIYKNSWMGLVEDVMEDVWIKLQDDSVVIVEDPGLLDNAHEPMLDGSRDTQMTGHGTDAPRANTTRGAPKANRPPVGEDDDNAAILCPGHMVTTTKANLRRGRWVYGSYNASIPPTGIIVQVKPMALLMNWICQNPMVDGRFIPIPPPPVQLDLEEDGEHIVRFRKSTGGLKDINGMPYNDLVRSSGGAELQVGDRVRFLDIDQAEQKYPGQIKKIPRRSVQGFEVNIFVVTETRTLVRVQWQDMTETTEETRSLIPYLNVDEHDVWPGEIVIVKPETVAVTGRPSPSSAEAASPPGADADYIKPSRVGVVQVADPAGRVAKVKWFTEPRIEVVAGVMVPGSKIGELEQVAEDASFYEIIAHPAIGLRRGDFVLIRPEGLTAENETEQPVMPVSVPTVQTQQASNPTADFIAQNNITHEQVQQLRQAVRQQFPDDRLIANLSATLRNHPHPQLQAMARMLTDVSDPATGSAPPPQEPLPAGYENYYVGHPTNWIGEVVSLGLDGLATVRLGGLEVPKDVELPIDRLHVIFNDDMDLAGGPGEDDGEDSDGWEDGNSEGWTTEEEIEGDVEMADAEAETTDIEEAPAAPEANGEPVPRTPPPIPENMPAPEAITLPSVDGAPSRFAVLDTPVPTDHHYLDKPAGTASALLKRIVREQKILAQSLPEGIFVRTWESRMDLLRVLIVGPLNTPYELAPFVFDFYLPDNFPAAPPTGFFHSWTHGIGRVNPNLYEDGNICLSLLGTWHAERTNETWNPTQSTILQLLVSLMGLVLVREPWYNEAGFSIYQGSADVSLSSQLYSEKAFMLARGFVRHALEHPVQGFEDVVEWLYLKKAPEGPGLLAQVLERLKMVVERSEGPEAERIGIDDTPEGVGRVSKGALVMLKRDLKALEKRLEAL